MYCYLPITGVHGKMMKHLIERKVINKKAANIYTDVTVDYFIKATEDFTIALMNELNDEDEVSLAYQYRLVLEEAKQ